MDAPSPQAQLDFLQNLQRLLGEGTFTATYKYALLLALADVCVERGEDTAATFQVQTAWLAEKFIAYYWRQARPYAGSLVSSSTVSSSDALLRQNTGQSAVVLTTLKALVDQGVSLADLQRSRSEWTRMVNKVAKVVREMPLWRLQVIGNQPLEFLYRRAGTGTSVELEPGVMFCFRHFHGLVTDLVRGAWVRYIRRQNQDVLGSPSDLDQFLFGSERAPLAVYLPILREVQEARCFYCQREVKAGDERAHVDHFVPWSRYPVDLGHNFVLAHGSCNLAKADYLAASEHLARWAERNRTAGPFLGQRFTEAKIVHDEEGSRCIVRWAYQQASAVRAMTWIKGDRLEPLPGNWAGALKNGED